MSYDPDEIIQDLWSNFEYEDGISDAYRDYIVSFMITYFLLNPSKAVLFFRLALMELDGWNIVSNGIETSPSCSKEELIASLRRAVGCSDHVFEQFAEALKIRNSQ